MAAKELKQNFLGIPGDLLEKHHQDPPQGIRLRVDIQEFSTAEYWKKHFELFIQALTTLQAKDADDVTGFYQIAGIHGLPYVPYDGAFGEWKWTKGSGWGGYCQHGSPLFPTWHRPYMLYIEQMLRNEARVIATRYKDPTMREAYVKAADELALPFWDWAAQRSVDRGAPDILMKQSVEINTPRYGVVEVSNPLYAFCLPRSLGTGYPGLKYNPTGAPFYSAPPAGGVPYTPEGFSTVRAPDNNCQTQVDKVNLTIQQYGATTLQPGVNAMLGQENYLLFSNHSTRPDPDGNPSEGKDYGLYTSLEVIHDAVHDAVGLDGGHMSYPDVAAFDPIFFMHHCNVDRLFAIWQALHPDSWVPEGDLDLEGTFTLAPGSKVDGKTPLTPFRKNGPGSDSDFFTSDDVRDILNVSLPASPDKPDQKDGIGYIYPDLLEFGFAGDGTTPDVMGLWNSMRDKYEPNTRSLLHWFVSITDIEKQQFGGPAGIRVFLFLPGNAPTDKTPRDSPYYVGTIPLFARGPTTQCAKCLANPDQPVNASLELTPTMERLGLNTNPEDTTGLIEKLKENVSYIAVSPSGAALGDVTLKEVTISLFQWGKPKLVPTAEAGKVMPIVRIPKFKKLAG